LPENGSIVFDTSQEILSMKNLCRIYETMLTEKQKLSNKELLEKDRKIAAMIDERDNLMDSVSVREKKTESKKGGLKNQALKMMKMEQNFLKIFEEKTDELDLEELKYSELLKSSTKKLKDAEEKIEQLKNNDEEQKEIKQMEYKNKVLEIRLNAMNWKNESLKNLINEFKE
jgi:DNA repair exonuclease SbcCD ATPase subunit